jgi:PAS domain S-box-containing protein
MGLLAIRGQMSRSIKSINNDTKFYDRDYFNLLPMTMSLRIKLTLFTVGFVLLASLAILSVSVLQIRQKEQRDISTLRTNELNRLQYNLKNSVNLISSAVEDIMGPQEMPENLISIIKRIKNNAQSKNADWIWILDTGNSAGPVYLSNTSKLRLSALTDISKILKDTGNSGGASVEIFIPDTIHAESLLVDKSHLYWYGQTITATGWILAVAAPLSNLDSAITERTKVVKTEIGRMIKDRMLFSFLLIIACAIAIFIFSSIITNPINRLVSHTESIATGRKGFNDHIDVTTHDEIGRLAESFNAMLRHIQDSMNKIEESAVKYRELVENANSAIIHIDSSGKVIFVNEYAQRLFGYSPMEVEGKNIAETIGKPCESRMNGEDMFLASEKYPYFEREHRIRNGNRIWVGWTNRSIFNKDHECIEMLCVGSDITKSKEAEKLSALQQRKLIQADKMVTLGTLVSGMGHEINNPNNYIILNAQTLNEMWLDISPVLEAYAKEIPDYSVAGVSYKEIGKEIPGLLQGIADGARRIKAIVQNLKDFSRTEPGDMTQKVDIAKVFDAARIILGNMIKKHTGSFVVHIPPDLPAVRGNFQRIEQVVINLLTNAFQVTDSPSKHVAVTAEYCCSSNEIAIAVSDNGKGIKPDDLKRIFDPFFTTKRDEGGTGLGLAISYSIAKDHGGDLRIESVENKGTIATLVLPVA